MNRSFELFSSKLEDQMKLELPDNRVIVPISGAITGEEARRLISELGPYVWGFKLHPTTIMRMFSCEHVDIIQFCHDAKARVFVDLKGFDIPSEIGNMIRDLEEIGMIDMATVHAAGDTDMIQTANDSAKRIGVFPVTILTTMKAPSVVKIFTINQNAVAFGATNASAEEIRDHKIKQLAALSASVGVAGTISSAADLGLFDEAPITYGNDFMIRCTPGIRPLDASVTGDDQDRVVTPAKAAAAGSDLIVVGRPISGAPDPVAAAQAIQSEFWNAKQSA